MRGFKDIDTLLQFTDGFLVYYNFLRPHEGLSGKTPAEVAKIDYQVKNWADVSRLPVSKTDYDVTRLEPRDAAEKPLLTGFGLENRI